MRWDVEEEPEYFTKFLLMFMELEHIRKIIALLQQMIVWGFFLEKASNIFETEHTFEQKLDIFHV